MLNLSNIIKWFEGGNLSFFVFLYTQNDLEQQWCRGVKLQQTQVHGQKNNRSFSSSKNSHFQNEPKYKTLLVKMSFIYKRIKNHFHIISFNSLNFIRLLRTVLSNEHLAITNAGFSVLLGSFAVGGSNNFIRLRWKKKKFLRFSSLKIIVLSKSQRRVYC